jgi:hypothetical protein
LVGKRRNMKRKGVQQITKAPITTAIIVVILNKVSNKIEKNGIRKKKNPLSLTEIACFPPPIS